MAAGAVTRDAVERELALLAEKHGLTLAEVQASKSGIGPVLKGQAGVNAVANAAADAGFVVEAREVTVKVMVDGEVTRVRPDLLLRSPEGQLLFTDAKNGPAAHLQPNQPGGYEAIRKDGFMPVGKNAEQAGLSVGEWHEPVSVWEVYLSR